MAEQEAKQLNTVFPTQVCEAEYSTITPIASPQEFCNLPTSPASHLLMQTLGTNGDIKKLETRAKDTRTKGEFTLKAIGNRRLIEFKKDENNLIAIELTDIEKMLGSRKGVKKMFLYSLVAINEQAYSIDHDTSKGVLKQDSISFSLDELVNAGLYKKKMTARVGFNAAVSALTSLKIKGKLTTVKGKKHTNTVNALEVMFTGGKIENNLCTLFLNDRIDWGFICKFYTVLPRWAFALGSVDAFDLMYNIFYLARQNVDRIKEHGYFTIGLKTVHARLGLPALEGNKKPSETIKEPIEKAITKIEELNNNSEFTITPVYNEQGSVKDYLENGYLKIGLAGEFAKAFIDRAEDKAQLIDSKEKQRLKVESIAKAKVLAEKIREQEEKR